MQKANLTLSVRFLVILLSKERRPHEQRPLFVHSASVGANYSVFENNFARHYYFH